MPTCTTLETTSNLEGRNCWKGDNTFSTVVDIRGWKRITIAMVYLLERRTFRMTTVSWSRCGYVPTNGLDHCPH
jgi:hypothetical protein